MNEVEAMREEVWVVVWDGGKSFHQGVGHVAIQTHRGGPTGQGYYMSYWPKSDDSAGRYFRFPFWCGKEPFPLVANAHQNRTLEDDEKDEKRPPDRIIKLSQLNVDKINAAYEAFIRIPELHRWALFGNGIFKLPNTRNCSGLSAYLLFEGEIDKIIGFTEAHDGDHAIKGNHGRFASNICANVEGHRGFSDILDSSRQGILSFGFATASGFFATMMLLGELMQGCVISNDPVRSRILAVLFSISLFIFTRNQWGAAKGHFRTGLSTFIVTPGAVGDMATYAKLCQDEKAGKVSPSLLQQAIDVWQFLHSFIPNPGATPVASEANPQRPKRSHEETQESVKRLRPNSRSSLE